MWRIKLLHIYILAPIQNAETQNKFLVLISTSCNPSVCNSDTVVPIQPRGKLTWYIVVWRFDSCWKVCVLGYGMSVVIQKWQLWQDI